MAPVSSVSIPLLYKTIYCHYSEVLCANLFIYELLQKQNKTKKKTFLKKEKKKENLIAQYEKLCKRRKEIHLKKK